MRWIWEEMWWGTEQLQQWVRGLDMTLHADAKISTNTLKLLHAFSPSLSANIYLPFLILLSSCYISTCTFAYIDIRIYPYGASFFFPSEIVWPCSILYKSIYFPKKLWLNFSLDLNNIPCQICITCPLPIHLLVDS